jgi:hypothetical protein
MASLKAHDRFLSRFAAYCALSGIKSSSMECVVAAPPHFQHMWPLLVANQLSVGV